MDITRFDVMVTSGKHFVSVFGPGSIGLASERHEGIANGAVDVREGVFLMHVLRYLNEADLPRANDPKHCHQHYVLRVYLFVRFEGRQ